MTKKLFRYLFLLAVLTSVFLVYSLQTAYANQQSLERDINVGGFLGSLYLAKKSTGQSCEVSWEPSRIGGLVVKIASDGKDLNINRAIMHDMFNNKFSLKTPSFKDNFYLQYEKAGVHFSEVIRIPHLFRVQGNRWAEVTHNESLRVSAEYSIQLKADQNEFYIYAEASFVDLTSSSQSVSAHREMVSCK